MCVCESLYIHGACPSCTVKCTECYKWVRVHVYYTALMRFILFTPCYNYVVRLQVLWVAKQLYNSVCLLLLLMIICGKLEVCY